MPALQTSTMRALAGACFVASALAAPTNVERDVLGLILNSNQLTDAISSFKANGQSVETAVSKGQSILTQIVPAPAPSSTAEFQARMANISGSNLQDIFTSGFEILLAGLAGSDYVQIANSYATLSNTNNTNPPPPKSIYPKADPNDAPYDLSEDDLRKIIYIPPGFTYGAIPPVLFLPGTAAVAGQNFGPNYGKLFMQNKIADPVYVNLPGENLQDIQVAAEYTAYAINYIAAVTGKNVSTISWSAGSLDGQWAFKYWPSTRKVVSNKIGISPDYHGTTEAQTLCPGFPTPGCTQAIAQQIYNSTFIRTLRNNGGDSAYVPTTNVYSIFDEIVEPQSDPNASGALMDARNVGVSNTELQSVCGEILPGGAFYNDHEGVLYNALAYALAVDAIQNPGPGMLSRVNTTFQCDQFATPGLSLSDILATEALNVFAVANILATEPKVATEPPIKAYAQKDIPA